MASSKQWDHVPQFSYGCSTTKNQYAVSPLLPKQIHNRQRSTEPFFALHNQDLSSATYSSSEHGKYVDKVFETIKFQLNQFNSVCMHQPHFQPAKQPQVPFKNLKEAIRYCLGFNTKLLQKVTELTSEVHIYQSKDQKCQRIKDLEEKQQEYFKLYQEIQNHAGLSLDMPTIQNLQEEIRQKEEERDQQRRDFQLKLSAQSILLEDLILQNEELRADNQLKQQQLLQHTHTQLKVYQNMINASDNSKFEDTQEIDMGHSRLDSLQNNEIEEVVLLKSQNPSIIHHQKTGSESPLTRALFGNESHNAVASELDELRVRVMDYQLNYVKKDYLIDLIDKLHETLVQVEVDASNLKDMMKNFQTNSSINSKDENDSATIHQKSLESLNQNMAILKTKLQKAINNNPRSTNLQNEVLDLKAEVCSLKNKLLQSEQRRVEEVNSKNILISQIEGKYNQEQRRRIEQMDEKERKIEELEKDIESTIEGQMKENVRLKDKVNEMDSRLQKYQLLENDIRGIMGIYQQEIQMTQMIQKLLNENKNLKESQKSQCMTIEEVRCEYSTKQSNLEEEYKSNFVKMEERYKTILIEMQESTEQQVKQKDEDIQKLKTRMAEKIDQLSATLESHLNQNQSLQKDIEFLKKELAEKENRESNYSEKVMTLREEKSKLKAKLERANQHLSDIYEYVIHIEQKLNIRDSHLKHFLDEQKKTFDNKEEMKNKAEQQSQHLKFVLNQLVEQKTVKKRDTQVQCELLNQSRILDSLNSSHQHKNSSNFSSIIQDENYNEILKLIKSQQANKNYDSQDSVKNEYLQRLCLKIEELQSLIEKQQKQAAQTKQVTKITIHDKQDSFSIEQDGHTLFKNATPKPSKTKSLIPNQYHNQSKKQKQTPQDYEWEIAQEDGQSPEELSKFWFEMYQRVKQDSQKDRKSLLDTQTKLQEKEEVHYQLNQKIYFLQGENETLQQMNSQYLSQLSEFKSSIAVLNKQIELSRIDIEELIDYACNDLTMASKQLKGEYMKGVITRIREAKKEEKPMVVVIEEFLNNYKTLLKQLQMTQQEVGKLRKQVQSASMPRKSPKKQKSTENLVNSQASTQYQKGQKQSFSQNRENIQTDNMDHHGFNYLNISNIGKTQDNSTLGAMPTDRTSASKQTIMNTHDQFNNIPRSTQRKSQSRVTPKHMFVPESNSTQTTLVNIPMNYYKGENYPPFKYVPGQQLTERQRLELYELKTAALREIEECEAKGKPSDPYLKKYVKSIDDLLKKSIHVQPTY